MLYLLYYKDIGIYLVLSILCREVLQISWLIGVSVAIATVAFVVLVVYVVKTLNVARSSIAEVERTLSDVRQQVDQLSKETTQLIQNTTHITADVQQKMASLDQLFHSVKDAGEAVHQVTTSAKQVSATVTRTVNENVEEALRLNKNRMADIVQWAAVGLSLWQKWKANQSSSTKKLEKGEIDHG